MNRLSMFVASLVVLTALGVPAASAQQSPEHIVTIYNIAPGKHLDFLKWMAEREAVEKELGAPSTQWYVHHNGASWDYISIAELPEATKEAELSKKRDELLEKKGMTIGMAESLEFRQFVASHTDTYVGGPFTAAELVKAAEVK
jgi:hypothetical protein